MSKIYKYIDTTLPEKQITVEEAQQSRDFLISKESIAYRIYIQRLLNDELSKSGDNTDTIELLKSIIEIPVKLENLILKVKKREII